MQHLETRCVNTPLSVVEMGKMKCLYAFDQPGVRGAKAFWAVNFKNKLAFIVKQLTEKRAPNRAVIYV